MRGNRQVRRKLSSELFVRRADGRLRPAEEGVELNDIWADQKRLQLKEAILRDEKKASRKQRWRRLFGAASEGSGQQRDVRSVRRIVEVKVQIPAFSLAGVSRWVKGVKAKIATFKLTKKLKFFIGSTVVLVGLFAGGFSLYGHTPSKDKEEKTGMSVLGADQKDSGPEYNTVLPADKRIEDLGGWGRVSPPDKDPVYAYVDSIGGIRITVSQQALPDRLKENTESEVAKLAEGFNARDKVTIGDTIAYIGTSAQGPQSVISSKDDLLLLIKSEATVSNEQWMAYLGSLQ